MLSFDMAPSGPGAPRTPGTFEQRWLDHMVPLRHPTGRLGSPRPQARREATGRPIVVQMTTPLNTRPAQMCTYSARMERSLRQEAAERIGNAGGHQLNSVAICCPVGRARFSGQLLEDFLGYDMWNALHVI